MTELATWRRWLRMGRENVAWGTAPADPDEYNMNGGLWHSFITTSPLGSMKYIEAKHRTKGNVGQRSLDQQPTVGGATRSEGTLEIPAVSDILGLLLKVALGGTDSASDTTDAAILVNGVIDATPETFTGASGLQQPTATKYPYLKIVVTAAAISTFNAGTVVVTGTGPDDNVLTETIVTPSLAALGAYTVYTKQNWKTLVSVVVTGWATGTGDCDIDGIVSTSHVIACADSSGSLSLEEFGDPGAGSGKSWLYTGLVIPTLTLSFSALEEEGLFVATPQLQGKYPTALTSTLYNIPLDRVWPSWTCSVTKGGVAYARIQNLTLTINTGTRLYRAAAGSANPQGKVDAGRTVELSGQLYLEDDTEYLAWKNDTIGNYEFTFTSPFKATSTVNHNLLLEFTETNFLTVDPKDDAGMLVADFTAFTLGRTADNAIKTTLVNAKNGTY